MKILNDIIASFYSSAFYGDVAHARRGIGMKFIFALTFVATALLTGYLVFYSKTLQEVAAAAPKFAADLPAVTVKDGKLSIDKPVPYNLSIGEGDDQVWITVDTNYKLKDITALKEHMETNKIVILVTEQEIVTIKGHSRELEVRPMSEMKKDFSITHQNWTDMGNYIAEKGVRVLIGFVAIGGFVILFLYNLFATFIGAIVMMIAGFILRAGSLEFGALMRLTAAARMPFIAIAAAPMMLGGGLITGGLSWLIWFGYLLFAVMGSKRHA